MSRRCGGVGEHAAQSGLGRRQRLVDTSIGRLIDLELHTVVDRLQLALLGPLVLHQLLHVAVDRVVCLGPPVELFLGHVVLIVMLGVSLATVRLDLDELHAVTPSGALDGELRRLVHREHVVPVHRHGRDAVALCLLREVLHRELFFRGRRVGPAVVLRDHDERDLLHRGEVQAFVEGAGRGGTVADIDQPTRGSPRSLKVSAIPAITGTMSPRCEIWPRYPFARSLKWTFSSRPCVGPSALAMYCRRIAIGSAPMTSMEPRLRISGDRMSGLGPRARAYADPTDSPSWPRERNKPPITLLWR